MLKFERTIPLQSIASEVRPLLRDDACFFDIETTGFSPASSHVYLIGIAQPAGENILITQLLAEDPEEEEKLLFSFAQHIAAFSEAISYNGIGFDVPFLQGRLKKYNIGDPFADIKLTDIFKEARGLKQLLPVTDFKQKTMEAFLSISRTDLLDGGELIGVYKNYCVSHDEEALSLILLHNLEDVLGMVSLMKLYLYRQFLCSFYLLNIDFHTYETSTQSEKTEVCFYLESPAAVPVPVHAASGEYYFSLSGKNGVIRLPLYQGELLYFHSDYQNYYYIPSEDRAIHKSLAAFIDKDNRLKCHAYNCYTPHEGIFLPQPKELFSPAYRMTNKDKESWFEVTSSFFSDEKALGKYLMEILKLYFG